MAVDKNVEFPTSDLPKQNESNVAVIKYVCIFGISFIALGIIAGLINKILYVGLSFNFLIIAVSAWIASKAFVKKYERSFHTIEYIKIILGSSIFIYSFLFLLLLPKLMKDIQLGKETASVIIPKYLLFNFVGVAGCSLVLVFFYSSLFVRKLSKKKIND